jgi:hypothetical protein
MKKTIILSLALILTAYSFSQKMEAVSPNNIETTNVNDSYTLHGRIVDSQTGYPLSFATVSINRLGIGTASNSDGNWALQIPTNAGDEAMTFTFMGYTTKTVRLSDVRQAPTVSMQAKSFEMAEVIVVPKDFCKDFLGKAYAAIPENYPTKPTLSEGFYRETERVNDSLFLYFNEAVLNVYKNTYRNTLNFGQIQVEKSRKNVFPGIDSINDVRFYGGPHFPNDLDIVFSRWDFIKPSEYNNWQYDLVGLYKDSIASVYTIAFRNKKSPNTNFQGRMFIDRDSYAFVGFELRRAGLSTISSQRMPTNMAYVPGNTTIKIGYTPQKGIYNLGYISYKTNGINTASNTRIYKDIEYVTTSLRTDSVFPISFSKQFDYTDILSIEAQDYDSSYWKDYNILEQSHLLDKQTQLIYQENQSREQLTKVYNRELTDQEKTLLFLKRFTFDGGLAVHPIFYQGGYHVISYKGSMSYEGNVATQRFGVSTMDGIRFELNKKVSLVGTISTALYGIEQVQFDLGGSYRLSLMPSGRWFFLDLGLAASTMKTKLDICQLDNPASMNINGKMFDAGKVDLKACKSAVGVKPILGLSVRMGKKYELFTDGSYFLPLLLKKEYLQFKETKGFFLSRKSAKIDWDNTENLTFEIDGSPITKPRFDVKPYQFRIGIRSGF